MRKKIKKVIFIPLLTIIIVVVLLVLLNMTLMFIHKNELTETKRNITITRHSDLFGEKTWTYDFYIAENTDSRLGISTGLFGEKTRIEILNKQNEQIFDEKYGSLYRNDMEIPLEKGYYTMNVYYHMNPFNHLVFTFKANNLSFTESLNENYQIVQANPEKGFNWNYILYTPESSKESNSKLYLMVETNNTGTPSDDMNVHMNKAKSDMAKKSDFADNLNIAYLMPIFPRYFNDYEYSHSFDRKTLYTEKEDIKRLDLQLIAMIDDAKERLVKENILLNEKIIIGGFSSSGSFASRFTVLHPEMVKAALIGAPGGWPIVPLETYKGEKLRFPIGIDGLEKFLNTPINTESLKEVSLFFFMGEDDTNDSVIYRDSFDVEDEKLIFSLFGELPIDRFSIAEEIYTTNSYNAIFKTYPGVGHYITDDIMKDIIEFIRVSTKE